MFHQLTIRDRVIIQYCLEHRGFMNAAELSTHLGVHVSSLYRELKRNALHKPSKQKRFMRQESLSCSKLNTYPFVCNACFHVARCAKERRLYDAYEANHLARKRLKSGRAHPQISPAELNELDQRVSGRVMSHQSLYHILKTDPDIKQCESTLRRYIDRQYLSCRNLDLPRTVRFPFKNTSKRLVRKRINVELLVNRTYLDYLDYAQTQTRTALQLDLMIGKPSDHKALLTLFEPLTKFQWGVLIPRSAHAVNSVLSSLIATLYAQQRLFFDCLIVDNGAEFQRLPLLEVSEQGELLVRVFFCDPYASFQKGGCERNHAMVRYVIKKGESFDFALQADIDTLFSHINSQRRYSLKGQSPYQRFSDCFHFSPSEFLNIFEVDSHLIHLKR